MATSQDKTPPVKIKIAMFRPTIYPTDNRAGERSQPIPKIDPPNDRIPSMYVTANDSGNMVDGFGPQIIFRATDSGATNSILGQMSFERSGADNSGKFRLQSKVAGADNTLMVIYPTGAMQLPDQPAFYAINASTDDNQTGNGPEFI